MRSGRVILKDHAGRNIGGLSREEWFPPLFRPIAQISRPRRFRVAPLILAAILPATLLLSPACGTPTEPEQVSCIQVSIVGTFSNAAGLATLVRLRLSPDEGDPVTLSSTEGTVPVAVTFRFQTRTIHTVSLTVVEQTSSPNTYRFSDASSTMAVSCIRRVRETVEPRTVALATGESIVYEFDFTRSILDPPKSQI